MMPDKEMELLRAKSSEMVGGLIQEIVDAKLRKNNLQETRKTIELSNVMRRVSGIFDLFGRRNLLNQFSPSHFNETITPKTFVLTDAFTLPFEEAAKAILEGRVFQDFPFLKPNQIYQEAVKLYGEERPYNRPIYGVEFAKVEAMKKANEILRDSILLGLSSSETSDRINNEMAKWSQAKGDTLYRTQLAKAYSAGQWRQAEDPVVRRQIGGVQYVTAGDGNVRPEHKSWHNYIAPANSDVWGWMTPPVYYRCRCTLIFLTHSRMKQLGKVDRAGNIIAGAHPPIPKENFGYRPNKSVYAQYGVA